MKKQYVYLGILLLLISAASAVQENYYAVDVQYNEGKFSLVRSTVFPLLEGVELDTTGSHTYSFIGKEGVVLEGNFSLKNTFLLDKNLLGKNALDPFEASPHRLEKYKFTLNLPYVSADKLQLSKEGDVLLEVDVGGFDVNKKSNSAAVTDEWINQETMQPSAQDEVEIGEKVELIDSQEQKSMSWLWVVLVLFLVLGLIWFLIRRNKQAYRV